MATDYTTGCGSLPLSFIQMLASTIVGYHDIAGVLHYRINAIGESENCLTLSDFLTCNTSHLDPERQLVENTFTVDDCSFLAWKLFANDTLVPIAYVECGEVPQTLIQMLARCIVEYDGHNRINIIYDTNDCQHITPLLDCNTNAIESERLLVQNIFALDDCGRLAMKLFGDTSSYTDYHTECTEAPESFYELLARCIVSYGGFYWLNIVATGEHCEELHAFWTCSNNHIDPERALVENVFAVDSCGNLAIKWFTNVGEGRDQ